MKEQLHQLLALANVSGVYIVDDALGDGSLAYEHFYALIRKIEATIGLEALDGLEEGIDFESNEGILAEYSRKLWEAASADKQLQYVRYLCDLVPYREDQDLATNLDITRVLEQLREEEHLQKAELVSMSPTDWEKQVTTITSRIPTGKRAIVLFDQKLERAGGRFAVTQGIDLAKELIDSPQKAQFLTGILTYTVPNDNAGEELIERARLATDKHLNPSDLFVLTKKRLEDLPHFVDGLKKMLLNEPCEHIKVQAIAVGEAALEATKAKLLALDTYDFNHTVLHSSLREGVWAPETLFRIIDIIYKDEIKTQLLDKALVPDLNKLLGQATELSKVEIPIGTSASNTERYRLRRQEMYASGELINGLFKPIENGDIFEVTTGTGIGLYILLNQPCDLAIRSNGKRAADISHLLKIKAITKESLETKLEEKFAEARTRKLQDFNFWKTRGVIEYIEQDPHTVGLVELATAYVVDLSVLDLTMFNSSGEAMIDVSATPSDALHIGLSKRFTDLKAIHQKLHNKLEECATALRPIRGPWPGKLLQELLPSLSLNTNLGKAAHTGTLFSFGIKRVKSLRDPYAKNLLEKYTRYLSRTGDLHDFAD